MSALSVRDPQPIEVAVAEKREQLRTVTDEQLGEFIASVQDEKATMVGFLGRFQQIGEDEIKARLVERDAPEFACSQFETAKLVDKYGEYEYDLAALKAARAYLESIGKEEEAVKVVKRMVQTRVIVSTLGGVCNSLLALLKDGAAPEGAITIEDGQIIVGEYFKPGNAVSITKLIEKYGETSEIGMRLLAARTREFKGRQLVLKRKAEVKNVTPAEASIQ